MIGKHSISVAADKEPDGDTLRCLSENVTIE